MASEMKRPDTSLLPWEAKDSYVFAGPNCVALCDTDNATPERYAANAAFIVRAVNSHDDLVNVLAAFVAVGDGHDDFAVLWPDARAALRSARGEKD